MTWTQFLLVGLGGFLGSVLRYMMSLFIRPSGFPFATLLVNLAGSFLIGIIVAVSLRHPQLKPEWRLFLATGFCGGFTTFSAFAIENLELLKTGQYGYCMAYVAGTVVLGIFAAYLGFSLGR
jgi:CrcB protein